MKFVLFKRIQVGHTEMWDSYCEYGAGAGDGVGKVCKFGTICYFYSWPYHIDRHTQQDYKNKWTVVVGGQYFTTRS